MKCPRSGSFEDWKAFLLKGRDPNQGRPVAKNTRALPVIYDDDVKGVGIRFYNTFIVGYREDGLLWLNMGGFRTNMTRRRITQFAPSKEGKHTYNQGTEWEREHMFYVPIFSAFVNYCYTPEGVREHRRTELWTSEPVDRTPVRNWKCRGCSGHKGHWREHTHRWVKCEGPCRNGGTCWGHSEEINPPERTWDKCYRCDGTGIVDYGSKPIYRELLDCGLYDPNNINRGAVEFASLSVRGWLPDLAVQRQRARVRKELLRLTRL